MINFKIGSTPADDAGADRFRLVLVADLVPRHAAAVQTTAAGVPVDRASFGAAMQALAGRASIEVTDPFGGRTPLRLDVPLNGPSAFRPRMLMENVAELRALAGVAGVLDRMAASTLEPVAATEQLRNMLPRREWAQAILEVFEEHTPVSAPPAPRGGESSGGRFSGLLSQLVASAGTASRRPTPVAGARNVTSTAVANLLSAILRDAEFRRLERAWQSVRLLLEHTSPDRVDLRLIPAAADGVEDALQSLVSSGEQPDLIIVDHTIDAQAADLTMLAGWADQAEAMSVPMVVNGTAGLLGFDSFEQLARTERRISSSDEPRAVVSRALAARDAMAWVMVAVNGFLIRPRHDGGSVKINGLAIDQDLEPADAALFGGASVLAAVLVARSLSRHQHPFCITGPDGGVIPDLNVRELDRGDGSNVALPLQSFFNHDVLARMAHGGVAAFTSVWNEATAVLATAPMLYRGPISADDPDPVPPLTLPDQLLASKLARLLQQVASAIPSGTPVEAITDVARLALCTVFENAAPPGPDIVLRIEKGLLTATVRPRRFGDVRVDEMTLAARLG